MSGFRRTSGRSLLLSKAVFFRLPAIIGQKSTLSLFSQVSPPVLPPLTSNFRPKAAVLALPKLDHNVALKIQDLK